MVKKLFFLLFLALPVKAEMQAIELNFITTNNTLITSAYDYITAKSSSCVFIKDQIIKYHLKTGTETVSNITVTMRYPKEKISIADEVLSTLAQFKNIYLSSLSKGSYIAKHKCTHDEKNPKPCTLEIIWEK